MFELRELAEWAAASTPESLVVGDVTCGACGKAGVRTVKKGEAVDPGPVYCRPCKRAKAEASSPAPAADPPPVPVEESVEAATWPRRSLT